MGGNLLAAPSLPESADGSNSARTIDPLQFIMAKPVSLQRELHWNEPSCAVMEDASPHVVRTAWLLRLLAREPAWLAQRRS